MISLPYPKNSTVFWEQSKYDRFVVASFLRRVSRKQTYSDTFLSCGPKKGKLHPGSGRQLSGQARQQRPTSTANAADASGPRSAVSHRHRQTSYQRPTAAPCGLVRPQGGQRPVRRSGHGIAASASLRGALDLHAGQVLGQVAAEVVEAAELNAQRVKVSVGRFDGWGCNTVEQ